MINRWQQIDDLFHAALECEPGKRGEFLAQACDGDSMLRQEVESLLASMEAPIDIIDNPPSVEAIQLLAEAQSRSLEGQTIQHFQILSRVGEGGMGEVYAALDQRLNRKLALKFLPVSFTTDEDQVRRFHHEARAASALNHPNIVTIYDLGQEDSLHFIAMEFIEGETLRQKMPAQMPFREVLNVAIQVASGLSAAHQAGILHRDIKPENVMTGNDGSVKVLDFGIAKFKEQQAISSNPQSETASADNILASVAAGTLSYMSPEQARGEPLDARTDIFSLGILLFEMVTGQRPFGGETQTEMLRAILNDEAPPLSAFRKEVPPDLERIVGKAIKKNRDERYQSAREMLADLREFNDATDKATDARERANRIFRQYVSIYAVDERALIPLTKLWFIHRHSDLERGERGRRLLRKSLRQGLLKAGLLVLLLAMGTLAAAAALSVDEKWDEIILKDGHTRAARQAAFSPDGRLLVSVGEDSKVIVWDFAQRMPLAVFTDHEKTVTSVAFSPDGRWFATGSEEGKAIVWDATKLERKAILRHQGIVSAVAFSPDGRLLASASCESADSKGRIILWNGPEWEKGRELAAKVGPYGRLLFESNSRLISSRGQKWNVDSGQELPPDFTDIANWMAASPDGTQMVTMASGGAVGTLDLTHHKFSQSSEAHQDSGRAAAYSPDGRLIATGADDIVLWDAANMTLLGRLKYPDIVWNVTFSPDGRWLVSTHGDGAIVIWDVTERRQVALLNGHSGGVRGVAFSPDGKLIASASEDRSVILWNGETGRKEGVLLGPASRLTGVAFSQDGERITASEFNRAITIWDRAQGQSRFFDVEFSAYCVAISPNNRWIATTRGVYDVGGDLIVDFQKAISPSSWQMYNVAFSPDGHWLVGVSPSRFIALFNTRTWQLHEKLEVPDATFISIGFSSDGKHLVTGDDEGTVRLWEIAPLRQVAVIGRHTSRIKSVAFSPDGREVCSAGDDQTIALWDVLSQRLITKIGTHTASVLAVAFSPDGKRIVSGEHDASVRVYSRHRALWGWRLNR